MKITVLAAMSLIAVTGMAHAELTIWQVENNPPGVDNGNEWLTIINTGKGGMFDRYIIQTTSGRIASHGVPTIYLDACEYYTITFGKQAIDNRDDTVKLLRHGATVYETPVIKDIKNDARFWTNPAVSCDSPRAGTAEPMTEADKDRRISELEAENAELKAAIGILQETLADLLAMLNALFGAAR